MNLVHALLWVLIPILSFAPASGIQKRGSDYDRIISIIRSARNQSKQRHKNKSQVCPYQARNQEGLPSEPNLRKTCFMGNHVGDQVNTPDDTRCQSTAMQKKSTEENREIREFHTSNKRADSSRWIERIALLYDRLKASPYRKNLVSTLHKDEHVPRRYCEGRKGLLDTEPLLGKGSASPQKQEKPSLQRSIVPHETHLSSRQPILSSRLQQPKELTSKEFVDIEKEIPLQQKNGQLSVGTVSGCTQESTQVSAPRAAEVNADKQSSMSSIGVLPHADTHQKNVVQPVPQAMPEEDVPDHESRLHQGIRSCEKNDVQPPDEVLFVPTAAKDVEEAPSDQEGAEAPGRHGCLYAPLFEDSASEEDSLSDEEDVESIVSEEESEEASSMQGELEDSRSQESELPVIVLPSTSSDEEDGSSLGDADLGNYVDVAGSVSDQEEQFFSVQQEFEAPQALESELQVISLSDSSRESIDNSVCSDKALDKQKPAPLIESDLESEESEDWKDCHSEFEDDDNALGAPSIEEGIGDAQQMGSLIHHSQDAGQEKAPQSWTEYFGTATNSAMNWLGSWWNKKK